MKRRNHLIIIAGLIFTIFAAACNRAPSVETKQTIKPVVQIAVDRAADQIVAGERVEIRISALDVEGISRVDLHIDGQPYASLPINPATPSFQIGQSWTPESQGSHIIQAKAFNVYDQASDEAVMMVSVAQAEATPTAIANDDAVQAAAVSNSSNDTMAPTATVETIASQEPTATPEATATAETFNSLPLVTSLVNLNVRGGPDTIYPVTGQLLANESALITGKNVYGTWFQIIYPANSNGRGWVAADPQYVISYNTANVPVVAAPEPSAPTPTPTEIPATATPTPVPATPTPTPEPEKPIIYSFTANTYSIYAGQKATLSWNLANAQIAHLHYDNTVEGVAAPGSKVVSPSKTTQYTLVASGAGGDTIAQITITVNKYNPPSPVKPGIIVPLPTATPKPPVVGPVIKIKP